MKVKRQASEKEKILAEMHLTEGFVYMKTYLRINEKKPNNTPTSPSPHNWIKHIRKEDIQMVNKQIKGTQLYLSLGKCRLVNIFLSE